MLYTGDLNELVSISIMLMLYSLVYIWINTRINLSRKTNLFIIVAIILRILLTITDTYFLYLPNSGVDSVVFENHAYELLEGISSLKTYTFDNYPKFIYFVYLFLGRKPLLIRTINGVLSILSGMIVYKSIDLINKDGRKASLGMVTFLLFPHSLIFSSVILRESLIVFFSTLSIYYFIIYTQGNKLNYILKSYISIIMGSLLHAGIIFISVPYIFYILFVKSTELPFKLKRCTVLISILIFIIIIATFPDLFLKKVAFLKSPEALFNRLNKANEYGINSNIGSAYLSFFRVYSFKDLMLYTPLKIFYFLFSPMPWDVRGIRDIIAITLDSIFYVVTIPKIMGRYKNLDKNNNEKLLLKTLTFCLIFVVGVYAMGTLATGTAIRHRYKCLSLIIIILISLNKKNNRIKYKNTSFQR